MRYEVGWLTLLTTATANAPICAIRTTATGQTRLREFGIFADSGTSSKIGLVRATTVSVTPSGNIAGQNVIPSGPVSDTVIVTGWATAPVIAATYLREFTAPATQGAGLIWTWPAEAPLIIGTGAAISELVITNLIAATFPALRMYACFED